jgi:hypothetical protein
VKILPPIGKYALYSRDEGDKNYAYVMTASGRLMLLDETARLQGLTEQKIDDHLQALTERFEKEIADPEAWVDFGGAAALDRIDDADAHNIPIRNRRAPPKASGNAKPTKRRSTPRLTR